MIFIEGKKYACQPCIRGHRASSCKHKDRQLVEIRPKGRPVTQCERCRHLRKTRKAHVKCLCSELADENDAWAADKPNKKQKKNGISASSANKCRASSIENLLNPCNCPEDRFCTCCREMFTEYLDRNYPPALVEETTKSLGAQLKSSIASTARTHVETSAKDAADTRAEANIPECPSGLDAPCCKTDSQSQPTAPAPAAQRSRTSCCPPKPHGAASKPTQALLSSSSSSLSSLSSEADGTIADTRNSNGSGQPDRPDCDCGCSCKQKLELLVQAIEARIGQPLNIDVDQAHSNVVDPEEWVESVLSPLSSTVSNDSHAVSDSAADSAKTSTTSGAGALVSKNGHAEIGAVSDGDIGQFAAGVLPPAVAVPGCCGSKSQAGAEAPASATPKRSCCSSPKSMESDGSSASAAPAGGVDTSAMVAPCCMPAAPQQVLPEQKPCCDEGDQENDESSEVKKASCCGGAEDGGCCCKKRKTKQSWRPGDPDNPEVDEDGALACSCGCSKPFEECTNCLEDLCEEVLFRPTF